MTMKVLAIFTVLLVSVQFLQAEAEENECTLAPRERTDCGFGGIPRDVCISKGCCFDSSIPGVIWCYKNPKYLVPEVEEQGKEEVEPEQQVDEGSEEHQEGEEQGQEEVQPEQEVDQGSETSEEQQVPETDGQEPVDNQEEQEETQSLEEVC